MGRGCPQGGHSIGQFWLNAGSMSKTFSQHWFSIYVRSDIYNWLFCKESQTVCCRLWPLCDDGHLDQNQSVWPASVPHRETWLIAQLSKRLPWNARGWEFKTRQLQMQFQKDERSCRFTYLRFTNSNQFVVPRIKTNTGSRAFSIIWLNLMERPDCAYTWCRNNFNFNYLNLTYLTWLSHPSSTVIRLSVDKPVWPRLWHMITLRICAPLSSIPWMI